MREDRGSRARQKAVHGRSFTGHSHENARRFIHAFKKEIDAFRNGPAALSKFILTGGIVKCTFYETDNRRGRLRFSADRIGRRRSRSRA